MAQQSIISTLIEELRRRRVFRVAAFYGGIAFVIVQIIDGTFEVMGIPAWVSRLTIIILALGFPISMILAWVFDITEDGIVRTKGRPKEAKRKAQPLIGNNALAIIALFAIAFGIWGRWGDSASTASDNATYLSSVAVLPFSNLNNDPDQEFFSDGITDNILTKLHKFGNLKVIGRTSVMQYKGTTKRLSEIGRELGVETLVEGTVQRVGNRIMINAQLIDVKTESHLWAEQYDRQVEDIFDIQNEVAQAIAEALQVTLTPEAEAAGLATYRPTENLAAYEAYVRGRTAADQTISVNNINRTISAYEEAVHLDPNFAEAWSELATGYLFRRWNGFAGTDQDLEKAEWALQHAQTIAPDNPAVINATGRYYYHGFNDYARALKEFYRALSITPTNVDVISNIGFIERRLGNYQEAIDYLLRAAELEPQSAAIQEALGQSYWAVGDLESAIKHYKNIIKISPTNDDGYDYVAQTSYERSGDINDYRAVMLEAKAFIPESDYLGMLQRSAELERDYDTALKIIRVRAASLPPGDWRHKFVLNNIGLYHRWNGNLDSATVYAQRYYPLILEERKKEQFSQKRIMLAGTARIEAYLGMADSARVHAEQAVIEYPFSFDALEAPVLMLRRAEVYFILGEEEKSLEYLDELLTLSGGGLMYDLLEPRWDELRKLDGYAALAKKHNFPDHLR